MLVIGLTGGIGSGKTTVANYFKELGVPVIDADEIARIIVLPGKPVLSEIVKHFGVDILDNDQQLDRTKLRTKIFNNIAEKGWLEKLLHPLIRKEIQRRLDNLSYPYAILVIPLLVETKYNDFLSRVLVVDVPESLQLERASLRDQCHEMQIKKIMATQVSRNQRLAQADDIITNEASLSSLKKQVVKMHQFYLKTAKDNLTD